MMFIRRARAKKYVVFTCMLVMIILYSSHYCNTSTGEFNIVQDKYPPCGEICQYTHFKTAGQNLLFENIRKGINCNNIMTRMAYTNFTIVYPPPEEPPKELYQQFTQNGQCPLADPKYIISTKPKRNPNGVKTILFSVIEELVRLYKDNQSTNPYQDNGCVMKTVRKYSSHIKGTDGVVIGTQTPWLEGMLLGEGMKHVTTIEYSNLFIDHPQMDAFTPSKYASDYIHNKARLFDFGATYSSLEHSGLGRYGDPLNPYGDIEAMAQAWCFTKPGGIFMLGVPHVRPGDHCHINWNAHRKYGLERLQQMSANWDVIGYAQCEDHNYHIIVILQKPTA